MRAAALLCAVAALLVGAPGLQAAPGRIAVGLEEGASPDEVAELLASVTGGTVAFDLEPLGALLVAVDDGEAALGAIEGLPGVEYVEPVTSSRRLAFQPYDPLALFQWYVPAIRAFDAWDVKPTTLEPVRVAVIDSGIDGSHPEFNGRVASTKSFVGTPAYRDSIGHGTMVAGEIAAALDNGVGIAGVAFPAQLLVAKVVGRTGNIRLDREAEAIKWAVDGDARVINLSLAGRRYSRLEQAAVNYAFQNGALVVAAAGNCGPAGGCPYVGYPAALPHVIGVSALTQAGAAASFSNGNRFLNDIGAPGTGIVSTFPRSLGDPDCPNPGYSLCAPPGSLRDGDGTSFAAPLVAAAAALVLAQRRTLTASQVMEVLGDSALDIAPRGRDRHTGNGRLDVTAALRSLDSPVPPADYCEPNELEPGSPACKPNRPTINATIDYFDDPRDVYRVYLRAGARLTATLAGPKGIALRSGVIRRRGTSVQLSRRAPRSGWYHLQVNAPKGGEGQYLLTITKS